MLISRLVAERNHIAELDGVRGCAIGLVLAWHFVFGPIEAAPGTLWSYVKASGRLTWSGVDLFFVLSGFLIGGILIDSRYSPNYFRTFYIRRSFRILPLYFGVLLLTLWVNKGRVDEHIPTFTYFIFLQNFWMARYASFGILLAASWSLAVEEQFYLTLPTVVRFVTPRILAYVLVVGILGAPALRLICYHIWPHNVFVAYVIMPCRADALLSGVMGAMALRNAKTNAWIRANSLMLVIFLIISIVGAAILTKFAGGWQGLVMASVGYSWLAALYLLVILFVVTQPQSLLASIMRLRWLRWLGSIAFGVYLLHQLIAGIIFRRFWHLNNLELRSWGNVGAMILAFGLTLAACQLSWTLFEKPLVKFGHKYRYD